MPNSKMSKEEMHKEETGKTTQSTLVEPLLKFLYEKWWRVKVSGFELLPSQGPAVIACNTSGPIPWVALMLIHIFKNTSAVNRKINILADEETLADERNHSILDGLEFKPWSYDNAKSLIEQGEIIVIFPEDNSHLGKTIAMRNRIKRFDWTKFLPAVESGTPVYPLCTFGVDESNLVIHNSDSLAQMLKLKAFPITPFFPWLPFPFNLATLPLPWTMRLMPSIQYKHSQERTHIQEQAKKVALLSEGEIQAEINRLLRERHRLF